MRKLWLLPFLLVGFLQADDSSEAEIIELESIVITAEKRPEAELKVERSIKTVGGSLLEEQLNKDIQSISTPIVNFQIEQFTASRLSFPYVRGIGAGQGNPAVTTNIDDVPQLSNNTSSLYLPNLERVEFLRGPQGTIYGRNALGGVINIHTTSPGSQRRVNFSLSTGSDAYFGGDLGLVLPLSESSSLGLDLASSERDGYTINTRTGNSLDDRDMRYGRLKLIHRKDNWELGFSWTGQRDRDGAFPLDNISLLRANPHQVNHAFEGHNHRDVSLPSMTFKSYGNVIDFFSVTSFGSWDVEDHNDVDFGVGSQAIRLLKEEQSELYQEIRFSSSQDLDHPLSWILGISFFKTDFSQNAENESLQLLPGPLLATVTMLSSAEIETEGFAIFSQVDYVIDEDWSLGLGLRYENEKQQGERLSFLPLVTPNPLDPFTQSFSTSSEKNNDDALLPRVAISRALSDQSMIYSSATKGFRAGGFNPVAGNQSESSYENEESWSYELGYKSRSESLDIGASLYYIDWDDMQLYLSSPGALVPTFILTNVGEATSQGGELELTYRPRYDLEVDLGLGLIDATFDQDFTDPADLAGNYAGNELPNAPGHTWSIELRHETEIDQTLLKSYVGVKGVGSYAYDHTNSVSQDSYEKVYLGFVLSYDRWNLSGRVDNLFDEEMIPLAFRVPQAVGFIYVGESGTPRTFKFQLGANF